MSNKWEQDETTGYLFSNAKIRANYQANLYPLVHCGHCPMVSRVDGRSQRGMRTHVKKIHNALESDFDFGAK